MPFSIAFLWVPISNWFLDLNYDDVVPISFYKEVALPGQFRS